jgi:uncharacterized low-complexity protein
MARHDIVALHQITMDKGVSEVQSTISMVAIRAAYGRCKGMTQNDKRARNGGAAETQRRCGTSSYGAEKAHAALQRCGTWRHHRLDPG